jgi:RNA polymerase sigma-70 factor (ECF subfamily)
MKDTQEEFLDLYKSIHESFARFCHARAYGLMDPEDLISESVLKALESFNQLRNKEAFLSFMFSIAKNIVNGKHRRQKFKGTYNEAHAHMIPDEGIDVEMKYDVAVLYEALNKLSKKEKEAIVLFEISGFSIKEVADIQNSGESAVKQRLKRGRENLAKQFKSDQLKQETVGTRSSILMSMFL